MDARRPFTRATRARIRYIGIEDADSKPTYSIYRLADRDNRVVPTDLTIEPRNSNGRAHGRVLLHEDEPNARRRRRSLRSIVLFRGLNRVLRRSTRRLD